MVEPFRSGEIVTWQRVRHGRVMSAYPMRIVADSATQTVLYQAPDTPFQSARTRAGGKVRDFSDWVLADLVWHGSSLIRVVAVDAWHCFDVEFDGQGRFDGWKVNFETPVQRTTTDFATDDLILDLVVAPDRSWQVEDADDLLRAVTDGHISADYAARAEAELADFLGRVERWEPPFSDDLWPQWTPPAAWITPPPRPLDRSTFRG